MAGGLGYGFDILISVLRAMCGAVVLVSRSDIAVVWFG